MVKTEQQAEHQLHELEHLVQEPLGSHLARVGGTISGIDYLAKQICANKLETLANWEMVVAEGKQIVNAEVQGPLPQYFAILYKGLVDDTQEFKQACADSFIGILEWAVSKRRNGFDNLLVEITKLRQDIFSTLHVMLTAPREHQASAITLAFRSASLVIRRNIHGNS